MRAAQRGDRAAFASLVERHRSAVLACLLGRVDSPVDAEEAAQAAWVKALDALARFRLRSSFRTWLVRIAINEARNLLRRRRFHASPPASPEAGPAWEGLPGPDQETALDRRLDLERALERLARRERQITVRRLAGYELREIARALGVSEGTVKSTLSDARRKLRKALAGGVRPPGDPAALLELLLRPCGPAPDPSAPEEGLLPCPVLEALTQPLAFRARLTIA
ncbi:MAG: sigma-70 family RNA polymerase sigma factor [Elusimicrobia bacterium]|nr:sigma-70 family RNA polymerase sigma factor [Elusimicrobiota bacterium]